MSLKDKANKEFLPFKKAVSNHHDPLIRHFGAVYSPIVNPEFDIPRSVAEGITKDRKSLESDKKTEYYELVKDKYVVKYDNITNALKKYFSTVCFNGTIYIYDLHTNKFRENNKDIEKRTSEMLKGAFRHKTISSVISEIINRIKTETTVQEYPFNNNSNLIPCKNGIYDLETGELKPHNPIYGFTYTINCEYNPDANSFEIAKYLSEIVAGKDVDYLEQIGACCLLQEAYKKAYLLYNKTGNNGKSLFLSVLTDVLGNDNVSNVSLQDLCNEKFRSAELVGKIANISADLPAKYIPDISLFKALTGDDSIVVEKKFQNPFKFRNKAPLIFGSNNVPGVSDKSKAFYNRIQIVEFPNVFEVNPRKFAELTTEENKSALLNIFIERARIILAEGIKIDDRDIRRMWEEESNISLKFINNHLINDLAYDDKISQYSWCLLHESVFSAYLQYCKAEDTKPHSQKRFDEKLKEMGFIIKFIGTRGNQVKTVQGIKFADVTQYGEINIPFLEGIIINIPTDLKQQNISEGCEC